MLLCSDNNVDDTYQEVITPNCDYQQRQGSLNSVKYGVFPSFWNEVVESLHFLLVSFSVAFNWNLICCLVSIFSSDSPDSEFQLHVFDQLVHQVAWATPLDQGNREIMGDHYQISVLPALSKCRRKWSWVLPAWPDSKLAGNEGKYFCESEKYLSISEVLHAFRRNSTWDHLQLNFSIKYWNFYFWQDI